MRIGIDARMYGAKTATGIGAYIKNLTDRLFTTDQVNQYVLFMAEPEFSQFIPPSNRVTKVKLDIPWYSLSEQLKLPALLRQHHLDLVHFPQFNVPLLYRGKYVVTIHDITPKFFPGPKVKRSIIRKLGFNVVFKLGLRRAKKIITGSQYTKHDLIDYFHVPATNITVTPLGFNSQFTTPPSDNHYQYLKEKLNITKPFLLYVGVWRDHKNLPNLVAAFEVIRKQYNFDCQLVLAGQQDDRYPEIKQAISKSSFKSDIITPGFVNQTDLQRLYQAAEVFVLPSFCEGFGLVALEAQSVGTPVVASSTTSLPEILGDSALYFDPNNISQIAEAIHTVATNQKLASTLVAKGFMQIKKYDWQATAKQTLAIYQSV